MILVQSGLRMAGHSIELCRQESSNRRHLQRHYQAQEKQKVLVACMYILQWHATVAHAMFLRGTATCLPPPLLTERNGGTCMHACVC
jgi:hypothetical protein